MNLKTLAVLTATAVCAVSGTARAATVTVGLTLDLDQVCYSCGDYINSAYGAAAAFSDFETVVAEGDTLDLTVDFKGLQQLTVQNLNSANVSIWTKNFADGATILSTGTLSFLGANGSAVYSTPLTSDSDGAVHVGQFFFSEQKLGFPPSSLTFSGMRWVGTVVDYQSYGVPITSRTYDVANLVVSGSNVELSLSPGVPEPATWALLIGGFGATGAALRRRRVLATA